MIIFFLFLSFRKVLEVEGKQFMTLVIKKALETLEALSVEYRLESQAARDQVGN